MRSGSYWKLKTRVRRLFTCPSLCSFQYRHHHHQPTHNNHNHTHSHFHTNHRDPRAPKFHRAPPLLHLPQQTSSSSRSESPASPPMLSLEEQINRPGVELHQARSAAQTPVSMISQHSNADVLSAEAIRYERPPTGSTSTLQITPGLASSGSGAFRFGGHTKSVKRDNNNNTSNNSPISSSNNRNNTSDNNTPQTQKLTDF